MTLQEAYQAWQQQEQNKQLFAKTRDAFRRAWFQLPTNKPCEFYTKEILGESLAATDQAEENKAKAASVMVHVLAFAHQQEPDDNPKPTFTFGELMAYTKAAPEKKRTIRKVDDEICQLDLRTLEVIKRWPHPHRIMQELGIGNVARAIERCGVAGGYYWSYSRELDTFAKRLAAHKDHNAEVHKNHCAQMRAAKEPQKDTDDTENVKPQNTQKAASKREESEARIDSHEREQARPQGKDTEKKKKTSKKTAAASPPELGGDRGGLNNGSASPQVTEEKINTENKSVKSVGKKKADQTTPAPPNSGGEAAAQVSPRPSVSSVANKRSAAQAALEVFTDDELFAELDRRGWYGYFSRTEIVTIGNK